MVSFWLVRVKIALLRVLCNHYRPLTLRERLRSGRKFHHIGILRRLSLKTARALFLVASVTLTSAVLRAQAAPGSDLDWPTYGGQLENDHYSALSQINRLNVHTLTLAWRYDTGEKSDAKTNSKGETETSPIIVGRTLYAYTPTQKVIALDAASGKLLWKFDPGISGAQPARGVAYWSDGKEKRLFAGIRNYLYCLDAMLGKPCPNFGEGGRIDLRKGLGRNYVTQSVELTSPGVIYRNLIIVGGLNPETHPAPPGDIRAFDVRTGMLKWAFHTIPHPGEFGYATWPKDAWKTAGAANNWAGMALDVKRGIVYVPTGSAVFDFYGGDRIGNNLFANTLLALDANTGKRLWHFQGVHHDIWDRDFPSPPTLVTVIREHRRVDAVAQTTKQGYLYLFNRVNGRPLFPIEEVSYPAGDVPGEVTSPTQPRPTVPDPYTRQILTQDMLTNRTPEARAKVLEEFNNYRSQGQFVPWSLNKVTVLFPGLDGGAEWGGPALDPKTGVIYINANDTPWLGSLIAVKPKSIGEQIYQDNCSICHGISRAGSPPDIPSLTTVGSRLSDREIKNILQTGRGRMPSFNMDGTQTNALLGYLKNMDISTESATSSRGATAVASNSAMPYIYSGKGRFVDPDGFPAVAPPWGTLNAIDLNTGKYLWKIPLGEYPALAAKGLRNTGSDNYGGPIVTGGGLLFIGATVFDNKFRAFDSHSGQLLWQTDLPFAGLATPSTYSVNGKQYVVIFAGGGKGGMPAGGTYLAYALP